MIASPDTLIQSSTALEAKVQPGLKTRTPYRFRNITSSAQIYVDYNLTPKVALSNTSNLGAGGANYIEFDLVPMPKSLFLSANLHFTITNIDTNASTLYSGPSLIDRVSIIRAGGQSVSQDVYTIHEYLDNCLKSTPFNKTQLQTDLGLNTNGNYTYTTTTLAQNASRNYIVELFTSWSNQLIPTDCLSTNPNSLTFRVYWNPRCIAAGTAIATNQIVSNAFLRVRHLD
jgi:hypothetical protein